MKILDPGHTYALDHLDDDDIETVEILRFVKRIGEKYPGNHAPAYSGTTSQEVLRALIDRMHYVNRQEQHDENWEALRGLRRALYWMERRAAKVRGDLGTFEQLSWMTPIEEHETCKECGHLACARHGR